MKNLLYKFFIASSLISMGACTALSVSYSYDRLPEELIYTVLATSAYDYYATLEDIERILYEQYNNPLVSVANKAIIHQQRKRCQHLLQSLPSSTTAKVQLHMREQLLALLEQERKLADKRLASLQAPRFWDDLVYLLTERNQTSIKPQNFLIDLIINMIIVSGSQYAKMLFNQEDQEQEQALTNQIKQVQQNFKNTQAALSQHTKSALQTLNQQVTQQLSTIQQTQAQAQARLLQEINYIQRLINVSIPPTRFIVNGIQYDQFFGASSMLTPTNGYSWYNIYQADDWEFDPATQPGTAQFIQRGPVGSQSSFVQATLASALTSGTAHGTASNSSAQTGTASATLNTSLAEQNSIFTEYFTDQGAYQIQAEVTLINCMYPFCAGIIFNKARWISGSPDRMFSYRFVGLYGQKTGVTPTLSLYSGQTSIQTIDGIPATTTPLSVIASGKSAPLYTLAPADIQPLGKDPITFVITITNELSQISITFDKKVNGQAHNLFATTYSFTDSSQNELLFWYHGIGFMAAGCQAAFTLHQPQQLTYTQQQLTDFNTRREQGLSKP